MTDTRDLVLEELLAAEGASVSGEAIAQKLGISRAAVAKHVAALRASGLDIEAHHGTGYAVDPASVLAPAAVRPLLGDSEGVTLIGGGPTGSTMDDARALAQAGAPDGTVVLASRQTAGRGRLGRTWESPSGGVYFSVIARPGIPVAGVVSLPLAASLGIAEALDELGVDATLKWPNDLELDGRKLTGILMEMSAEADRVAWVIIGVGINVRPPSAPFDGAAYLDGASPGVGLSRVAALGIRGVRGAVARAADEGFEGMRARYEARFAALGHNIVLTDPDGRRLAEGQARGVDGFGRLIIREEGGDRTFASGDVSLRRSPAVP